MSQISFVYLLISEVWPHLAQVYIGFIFLCPRLTLKRLWMIICWYTTRNKKETTFTHFCVLLMFLDNCSTFEIQDVFFTRKHMFQIIIHILCCPLKLFSSKKNFLWFELTFLADSFGLSSFLPPSFRCIMTCPTYLQIMTHYSTFLRRKKITPSQRFPAFPRPKVWVTSALMTIRYINSHSYLSLKITKMLLIDYFYTRPLSSAYTAHGVFCSNEQKSLK